LIDQDFPPAAHEFPSPAHIALYVWQAWRPKNSPNGRVGYEAGLRARLNGRWRGKGSLHEGVRALNPALFKSGRGQGWRLFRLFEVVEVPCDGEALLCSSADRQVPAGAAGARIESA